jgi:serine/tyrosine/threonine adenylyltransferase
MLADYAIARHYPEAARAKQPYRALLDGVIARQARLVAQWMLLGFIHGVMNTDNTSISGETIDYGPCAFMEAYDPATVFSSIDRQGRYAYANQPAAAHWNLTRLAEALLPVLLQETGSEAGAVASANEALAAFVPQFEAAHKCRPAAQTRPLHTARGRCGACRRSAGAHVRQSG